MVNHWIFFIRGIMMPSIARRSQLRGMQWRLAGKGERGLYSERTASNQSHDTFFELSERAIMRELTSSKAIIAKGLMFLVLGCMTSCLLGWWSGSWSIMRLHFISIWAFCRFYYFAFYVIEHYVDGTYRFDGLYAFAWYLWRRRR